MTDDEIAIDIRVRLDTAINALRAAQLVTPERNPFRKIDDFISQSVGLAIMARHLCKDMKA